MRDVMNRDEMIRRINEGEDALELSIEKWERVREIVEGGVEVSDCYLCSETCGLCHEADEECLNCRYFTHHDCCCEGVWFDAMRAASKQPVGVAAIDILLERLREIREVNDSEEVVSIEEDIHSLCLEVADYLGRMDRTWEDNDYGMRLRLAARKEG